MRCTATTGTKLCAPYTLSSLADRRGHVRGMGEVARSPGKRENTRSGRVPPIICQVRGVAGIVVPARRNSRGHLRSGQGPLRQRPPGHARQDRPAREGVRREADRKTSMRSSPAMCSRQRFGAKRLEQISRQRLGACIDGQRHTAVLSLRRHDRLLQRAGKIRFSINAAAAERAGLKISSHLLKLAVHGHRMSGDPCNDTRFRTCLSRARLMTIILGISAAVMLIAVSRLPPTPPGRTGTTVCRTFPPLRRSLASTSWPRSCSITPRAASEILASLGADPGIMAAYVHDR